jgi:hypothetical protein
MGNHSWRFLVREVSLILLYSTFRVGPNRDEIQSVLLPETRQPDEEPRLFIVDWEFAQFGH